MNLSRYVGLPFADRGRGPEAFDCWGLLRHVYAQCLGVDLPSHDGSYRTAADRAVLADLIPAEMEDWRPVAIEDARLFDGVLMTEAGVVRHIGIVAGPRRILHIETGSTSVIVSATSLAVRSRIAGYFRHVSQ